MFKNSNFKTAILGLLGVFGFGNGSQVALDHMPNLKGLGNDQAKRCRTPNKSEKRTWDFRQYDGNGYGWFQCRQTGEMGRHKIHVRNPSKHVVNLYGLNS